MNHRYIAFASFKTDWPLVNELYPQAAGARITLQALKSAAAGDLPQTKLWIDAQIDGLHFPEVFSASKSGYESYKKYIEHFPNARKIIDTPDRGSVATFVNSVLDTILEATEGLDNLGYISVPQLPYTLGAGRNKINRTLAELSFKWKGAQRRPLRLILPVVFAKQWGQTDTKTDRNSKVKLAATSFENSGADGIWVVDSTLDDHAAASTLENQRFPGIIHFHEELNAKLPSDTVTIAGPYWGLNLALWSRGLVRFPAIGVGRGYQYSIPGREPQSSGAKIRVAVPPLKRLVVSTALKPWLQRALHKLDRNDPAYNEFAKLAKSLDLTTKERARRQIAGFYRDWLLKLESVPVSSRALTLYQDLSAAFVLGSRLEPFDKDLEDVPNPAIIAKQLMVNCL
jgi:hypothetical protein